jgi:hypothetical protein
VEANKRRVLQLEEGHAGKRRSKPPLSIVVLLLEERTGC